VGAPILLQTYPRGLLGWLRQRIGGAAPDQVATVLQPTIDAGRLYRDLRTDREVIAILAAVNSQAICWTVPSNQRWELMSFTVQVDLGSPEALVGWLGVASPTGEQWQLANVTVMNNNAGLVRTFGIQCTVPQGLLLDPGSSLSWFTGNGVAGVGPWVGVATASWYELYV